MGSLRLTSDRAGPGPAAYAFTCKSRAQQAGARNRSSEGILTINPIVVSDHDTGTALYMLSLINILFKIGHANEATA